MRCLDLLHRVFHDDIHVNVLADELQMLGYTANTETIICAKTQASTARSSFLWKGRDNIPPGSVVIHEQNVETYRDVLFAVRHELTHAYDMARSLINLRDCKHAACSEIRAYHLSGECDFSQEMRRALSRDVEGRTMPRCVRRRAQASLESHPLCRKTAAADVDAVFNICYRDVEPLSDVLRDGRFTDAFAAPVRSRPAGPVGPAEGVAL